MRRRAEFDELAGQEEGGEVADAGGLLHVVGDDGYGAKVFQGDQELFNFRGTDGVESGARLVEQQDFGFYRQGSRNAKALLLAAGEVVGGFVELIFYFVPEGGVTEAFLYSFCNGELGAVDAETVGYVVEDGFREGVGSLEDHANAAAKLGYILGQDVLTVEEDFAFEACVAHGFVHAIQGAEQCRFPAAGRTDQSGDFAYGDTQADVEKSLLGAVEEVHVVDAHAHRQRGCGFAACGTRASWCDVYGHSRPHRSVHGLGPRNRNATGQDRPREDIDDQNQA